jgi:hypothetical protein
MSENPDLRQVEAVNGRRHHGQLHDHSFLAREQRFSTSDVHTGAVFTAEVERLLQAIQQWQKCADEFAGTLQRVTLATRIQDGSGPVANALGTRFNHRIGTAGGVGYASDGYLAGLRRILDGLVQTTESYARTEADNTDPMRSA